jgi:hypothetical protein
MHRCTRCDGFVPKGINECPNCRSTKKAWWMAPLAFAGAGLATVTLSACYGAPCVASVKLPDGGVKDDPNSLSCTQYDCTKGPDGGAPVMDSEWDRLCK